MAHRNKVVMSVNDTGEVRCVDVFVTPEGLYGFAEYRRDPEDPSGWRPTYEAGAKTYQTREQAEEAAVATIGWLAAEL